MKRPIHRLLGGLCAGVVCCILGACSDRADESGFSVPDGQVNRISLQSGIMPIADFDSIKPPLASALKVKYSNSGFSVGDSVGFFSRGGKIEGGSSSNFLNLKLIFNGRTFNSDVLSDYAQADPNRMERIFSYYPYTEGKDTLADIYAKIEGSDEHEEPLRVIDFLTTNYSGNGEQMNGGANFYHTFAIVRVALGDGFKDFDGDIYLQLERKVKSVWIDMNFTEQDDKQIVMDAYITGAVMKLVYDDTATSAESRRLKTFSNEATGDNKRWDVIVPCRPMMWWHMDSPDAAEVSGVTVQAIILHPKDTDGSKDIEIPVDNYKTFVGLMDGNYLYGIRGSYIYTVRVVKEGFEASVFPVDVQEWNTEEIKETIPRGINDASAYKNFIMKYNELFSEKETYGTADIAAKAKDLTEWGDAIFNGTDSVFTVFLTNDIDLSGDNDMDNLRINNLQIPIDGRGKTIRHCILNGSFCKKIDTGGSLKNLRFEGLRVESTDTVPVGLLAGTMDGGIIDGCQVTGGWLAGASSDTTKVGAAVGTMNNGTVKNCQFDGLMFGTSDPTNEELVGKYVAGSVTGNNNRNNMTVVKQ